MKQILVFDVGGTNLRAGVYQTDTGTLHNVKWIATQNHRVLPKASGIEIVAQLFDAITKLGHLVLQGAAPDAVCLAFPGPIDSQGNALAAPTVWGDRCVEPVCLSDRLKKIWPSATSFVLNDVTAAGYRYLRHPEDGLCIVTVSSGIGNKVFVNGRAMLGSRGMGGEIGHLRVDFSPEAPVCDCGGRGHLGAVASGRASLFQAQRLFRADPNAFVSSGLGRQSGGNPNRIDNASIVEFYQKKDPWVVELVHRLAQPLAQVLASLHLALGTERFVIIGGFALALGESYRRELVREASACSWNLTGDWESMLELGATDGVDGLAGAGRYATFHAALGD